MIVFNRQATTECRSGRLYAGAFAEFLGTLMILFIGSATFLNQDVTPDLAGIAFGLTISAAHTILGHHGGCHFNPAFTVAFCLLRKISLVNTSAGPTCRILVWNSSSLQYPQQYHSLARSVPGPSGTTSNGSVLITEAVLSGFLVMLILFVCFESPGSAGPVLGLVIGLYVFICHLGFMKLSGSSLNPARNFGPAMFYGNSEDLWLYYVGPTVGSIIGGFIYDFILAKDASLKKLHSYISAVFFCVSQRDQNQSSVVPEKF